MSGRQAVLSQARMRLPMPVQLRTRLLVSSVLTISLVVLLVVIIVIEGLISNADTLRQSDLADAAQRARTLNVLILQSIDETDAYALGQLDRLDVMVEHARTFSDTMAKLRQHGTNQVLNQNELQMITQIDTLHQSYETAALGLIGAAANRRQVPSAQNQALVTQAWQQQNQVGSDLSAASQNLADQLEGDYRVLAVGISQRNRLMIGAVLTIGVLMIGIIVVIQFIASRAVGAPIDTLKTSLKAFLAGDQAQRVGIARPDEIGMLAESCNTLMATIQQQTAELQSQVDDAERARHEAETAQATISEKLAMIERQQMVIDQLSVPILPLSERVLVMPLIGALDSQRIAQMQTRLLTHARQSQQVKTCIIDITGVPIVDTQVARGLISSIRAARLIGVDVLLVGIRPEVAHSIVGLGIHLGEVATLSTLQQGIEYAFSTNQVRRYGT